MLVILIFPTSIGLLLAYGSERRIIQLAILGVIVACGVVDLFYGGKRKAPRSIWTVYILLINTVSVFLVNTFDNDSGLEGSKVLTAFLILLLGLAVFICTQRTVSFAFLKRHSSIGLGLLIWSSISVVLTKLGFVGQSTLEIYGGHSESVMSGGARELLVGFRGIISGGICCTLGAVYSISCWFEKASRGERLVLTILGIISAAGIVITDTRSGATILAIIAIFLASFGIRKVFLKGASSFYAITDKVIGYILIFTINIVPLFVPLVEYVVISLLSDIGGDFLFRKSTESTMALSGRTDVWSIALEYISAQGIQFITFNPIGEYGAGVSGYIHSTGVVPGAPESAHSHNAIMNTYFSFGLIGVGVLNLHLALLHQRISKCLKNNQVAIKYMAMFYAILLFSVIESMFSVLYVYFMPALILLSLEAWSMPETENK